MDLTPGPFPKGKGSFLKKREAWQQITDLRARPAVLGAITVLYILFYPWLRHTFGDGVTALSLVPVVLASWSYGLKTGLVFSLFAFLLNVLLVLFSGSVQWSLLMSEGGIAGSLALVFIGGVVGYLSDLRRELDRELAVRKRVEAALRVSERFNGAILQALSASIAVLNRTGQIVEVNEAWKSFGRENGAREDRIGVGMNYLAVCRAATGEDAEIAAKTAAGIQSVLEGSESLFALEYPCHSPKQKRWYLLHVTPLMHDKGGAVISHINITDRVQAEQKLEYLATHDALTGLFNRTYFEQQMTWLADESFPVSVVMADLDGLKQVNDQFGHAVGDQMISQAAELLKRVFRAEDQVARIGGDEFAVLLPQVDEALSRTILKRVAQRMVAASCGDGPPFGGGPPFRLSLGVATALNSAGLAAALKQADQEMYEDKLAHRGGRG